MRFSQYLAPALALAAAVEAVPTTPTYPPHGKPLVESNKLRRVMYRSELLKKAKKLEGFAYATPGRNRVIGSAGHNSTIKWIKETMESYPDYYNVYLEPFPISVGTSAKLTISGTPYEAFALTIAPAGTVSGEIVVVKNLGCDVADFPADLTGKVALIFRGSCISSIKDATAASLGAAGVIIYNNSPGNLEGYSLQLIKSEIGPYIPAVGVSQADGEALVAAINGGAILTADFVSEAAIITTYNVNAQTKGGDQDNVIVISGHSDSVAQGPGINDNGSGSISILEVAEALTDFSVNNAVRFSWWTGEEAGLIGATWYVEHTTQAELDKIRLMLDFDMMASPNYAYQIYDGDGSAFNLSGPQGSGEAEREFQRFFTVEAKENWTSIEFDGRSDYGPFLAAGVATGGIACGAEAEKTVEEAEMFGGVAGVAYDVNYHAAGDNVKNLNMGAWIVMTKAIAHMTATYARSFEGLHQNVTHAKVKRMEYAQMAKSLPMSAAQLRKI